MGPVFVWLYTTQLDRRGVNRTGITGTTSEQTIQEGVKCTPSSCANLKRFRELQSTIWGAGTRRVILCLLGI